MLGHGYEGQNCSAARALEAVGERWSLLIMRDALGAGVTRFVDFQRSLGIARNVLSARLERFVAEGLMERRPAGGSKYQEYVLTEKGRDLRPIIIALINWGDRWAAPNGPPVVFEHSDCSGELEQKLLCARCGEVVAYDAIHSRRGPGAQLVSDHARDQGRRAGRRS
jgi:DNA-binding HxlR family transcriptional regulator